MTQNDVNAPDCLLVLKNMLSPEGRCSSSAPERYESYCKKVEIIVNQNYPTAF
jgi:hypothetical protein